MDCQMSDKILYRTKRGKSGKVGDLEFRPALPNDQLMGSIMNNKVLMSNGNPQVIMQKVIDMEWRWFERRIIKFCGNTEESHALQHALREHIKKEKKWIAKGAKADAI